MHCYFSDKKNSTSLSGRLITDKCIKSNENLNLSHNHSCEEDSTGFPYIASKIFLALPLFTMMQLHPHVYGSVHCNRCRNYYIAICSDALYEHLLFPFPRLEESKRRWYVNTEGSRINFQEKGRLRPAKICNHIHSPLGKRENTSPLKN